MRRRTNASSHPHPTAPLVVLGLGPVGLVTAAGLAKLGATVIGVDTDTAKIRRLVRDGVTIHEPGLPDLAAEQVAAGRLSYEADPPSVLPRAGMVVVTVGTPTSPGGAFSLAALDTVLAQFQAHLPAGVPIVLKSTVPIGTARRFGQALPNNEVVNCPEFLREGCAVEDFMRPDRILVGSDAEASPAVDRLRALFAPLLDAGVPMITMDTASAELAKCAANAMLATRISFINEIAPIAAATGADIEAVARGIGSDHRIGPRFLQAGLGYGGSCFGKDVAALRHTARSHGLRADLLGATERVNIRQRSWPLQAMRPDFGSATGLRGLHVAVWGLAFKPDTDDLRDAPSLTLIDRLARAGVQVSVYDPVVREADDPALSLPRVRVCEDAMAALQGADVLILATEWAEFTGFDPQRVAQALALRIVYDGRNALDAGRWRAAGLRVVQVGRPEPVLAAVDVPAPPAPKRRPGVPVEFTTIDAAIEAAFQA